MAYPHPDWKAWDFYEPETVFSPARFIEVIPWHVRHDVTIIPWRYSDQVYCLNQDLGYTYYSGSGLRNLWLRPVPGYNKYDRTGSRILWKRIVLRLVLETNADMLEIIRRPEILRISLVYCRVASGGSDARARLGLAPVRWQDVYDDHIGSSGTTSDLGVFAEMNLANRDNIIILKEWMFSEGTTDLHLDPLDGFQDVLDRTQKKCFVHEMDLPDLPNEYVHPPTITDPRDCEFGHGDLCLLVNSTADVLNETSSSRYVVKFSGRLYFVDA